MGDLSEQGKSEADKQLSSASMTDMSLASSSMVAPMQLYIERLSAPCRIVWLYMLQHNLALEVIDVDFQSEAGRAEFTRDFSQHEIPLLVDNSNTVFTAPAILNYLAEQYTGHAGFGLTLQTRLTTQSLISWANSELHRCAGYSIAFPSCMDAYRLHTDAATEELVESGMRRLARHVELIESQYLSKHTYLTGERATVADSFVATVLLQAQWNGFRYQMWPRVERWLQRMRAQEFWSQVHRAHNKLVQELEQQPFCFD